MHGHIISIGVDSATSTYSCIWCKCSKEERSDFEKTWSLTDASKGARSIEENVSMAKSGMKRGKTRFNISHEPLFAEIPLTNVVIDNLHLFLRTSDVLIDLLIVELKRQDAIDKATKLHKFDKSKYKHLSRYEEFVSKLNIPGFQFYVGQASKALKCRSLTGPEKHRLMLNIKIKDLLPSVSDDITKQIQDLWNKLLTLNMILSKDSLTTEDISRFEVNARHWCKAFIECYHVENVTPYIHAMMNHVPEFLKIHGSIVPFTQQGLEKYNDISTKMYFRSTNHKGTDALLQIIQKQNRLDYLKDIGISTVKCFSITCSLCHQDGHNCRTCSLAS